MVLLGDEAQVEACFGLFGDSTNFDVVYGLRQMLCTLKINLDAPEGNPRWRGLSGSSF
jgi:hypothetical protein